MPTARNSAQFSARNSARNSLTDPSHPHASQAQSELDAKLMGLADKNGDGEIDYEEFAAALAHSHQQRSAIFGRNDDKGGMVGHIAAPNTWGGQVYFNDNVPAGGDLGALRRAQGHVHPDFKPMELPHASEPATQAELAADIDQLKQRIATKYKLLTNAFRTFDEDHSGYIGREELEHGIPHFNMTIPHEHVKQIVDQLDTDHDGKISYAEFARLLHSQEAQSVDIFGRSHTERNAVEDPILSFPDPNHVGNAHLHINRHPEMR